MSRFARFLIPLACAASLAAPAVAAAAGDQPSPAEARRALHAAREVLFGPDRLSGGPVGGSRDASAALRELAVALPALRGSDRRRARELLDRPTNPDDRDYLGTEAPESPLCNSHFCVHWAEQGRNATSRDFVDEVVAATNRAFAIENVQLGWREPKPDAARGASRGRGAGGQVDVYITGLGRRLYGYAAPDPGQRGARRFAYLVLDNDYTGFPSPPLESMRVTVAHEYNHILQFNYDTFEDLWMFESTATWMEEHVYPGIDDYLNYLPAFAALPQEPLTGKEKIYADSVWNHWLEHRYGPAVVRDAWAQSPSVRPRHDSVSSYEASIRGAGGRSFSREFARFAAATAEWRSSHAFPDARDYPDMRRRGTLRSEARRGHLDNASYRLYDVPPHASRRVTLTFAAQRGTRSAVALVGRDGRSASGSVRIASRYLDRGGKATVRLPRASRYERITAVVINADGRGRAGRRIADDSSYSLRLTRLR